MDIRKLRAFIVLAETLSYHRAADKLCITQPALTKQINGLEERLKCVLFDRGPDGTQLTELGKLVYSEAKALMNHVQKFMKDTDDLSNNRISPFRVGAFAFDSYCASMFKKFSDLYPTMPLVLLHGMLPNELAAQLSQGMLNLAIMPYPIPNSLSSRRLFNESIVILEKKSTILDRGSTGSTNHEKWQVRKELEHQVTNLYLDFYTVYDRMTMKPMITTNDITMIVDLIIRKDGFALVPESAMSDVGHLYADVIEIKKTGIKIDVGLAWEPNFADEITHGVIEMFFSPYELLAVDENDSTGVSYKCAL
jgi:DNA-binding transcriptional LysR family regulator